MKQAAVPASLKRTIKSVKVGHTTIITPRLNLFLMRNPNLALDENIADLIRELIIKKQRDRSGSFSSSASGTCPRRQIYQYLGLAPDEVNSPQLQNIFYDGTWRHLRWQATLLQAGILSDVEIMLDWPAKRSMGSMDGQGIVPGEHMNPAWRGLEFGFELKGINSFGYKSVVALGPTESHLNQTHRYFLSGGLDLFVIIYENKDTQEWTEYVIEPDPVRMEAQRAELALLNDYVDAKIIPPMLNDCAAHKGTEFSKCPFGGKTGICVNRSQW
jgi:hypothetical protein